MKFLLVCVLLCIVFTINPSKATCRKYGLELTTGEVYKPEDQCAEFHCEADGNIRLQT